MGGKEKTKHVVIKYKNILPIKITIKDIPQIIEIYKSYWGNRGLYDYSSFKSIIEQNLSYAFKIGDEIIGFCLIENRINPRIIEIDLLCIKKGFQGNHFGENLLCFCINICRNLKFQNIALHVSTTNIPALTLYTKLGFKINKVIKQYYHDENPKDNNAYYLTLNI